MAVPQAPDAVVLSSITQTTMTATFTLNGNGGSAITQRQIGYGTNSSTPQHLVTSDGSTAITGLAPGTTYYFWARARNVTGWSPYSPRKTVRTIAGARIKVAGVWKEAIPYVKVAGVWKLAQPWTKVAGVWKKTT